MGLTGLLAITQGASRATYNSASLDYPDICELSENKGLIVAHLNIRSSTTASK